MYLLNSIPAALNLFVMKDSFSNIFSEKRRVLLHEPERVMLAFISRTRRRARALYPFALNLTDLSLKHFVVLHQPVCLEYL